MAIHLQILHVQQLIGGTGVVFLMSGCGRAVPESARLTGEGEMHAKDKKSQINSEKLWTKDLNAVIMEMAELGGLPPGPVASRLSLLVGAVSRFILLPTMHRR